MGLLKNYCHHSNVTACAIEFTQTVGVDLHVRPKVPSRKTVTALRHPTCGNQNRHSTLLLQFYEILSQQPQIKLVKQSQAVYNNALSHNFSTTQTENF